MYKYNCEICGMPIYSKGKKRIIKCEACLKRERSKRAREKTNSPYRKYTSNSKLQKEVHQIEVFNRLHNTKYTYGKYELLKTLKKI